MEDRTLLSASPLTAARLLTFNPLHTAQAAAFLADPREADLYRVSLGAGDVLNAAVSAQATGSGLQSLLRVFDASGTQLAADDQQGGDPRLTFQAATTGDYYVGVSSAPNAAYDPRVQDSGTAGGTTGLYTLTLRDTVGAAPLADLAGASFRLGTSTAAWGEAVPVAFTVEDRGAAAAGAFEVQVLVSVSNLFAPASSAVVRTFSLSGLAAGQAFASGGVTVTLPDLASAAAAGLPVSGPVYLGLRIDPAGAVPELNPHDQGGVHRGEDWEALTLLTPVPAGVTDLSQADPNLDTRAEGTLLTARQADTYTFTVTAARGSGRLTADVAPAAGTLAPLLTLAASDGTVLVQSDGQIVQHLQPGSYSLTVSARSGAGSYRLTTEFVAGNPPLQPPTVGVFPKAVAVADLTGDGIPDLITANYDDSTVSVLLGNGDGTFQPQKTYAVGYYPASVAVADLNGDGIPDLVVANQGSFSYPGDTVSVLLGNGDGTFQPQQTFTVGNDPAAVAVADLTGDGIPDIITANRGPRDPSTGQYLSGTVSVLLGDGDGTFQPQRTFAAGSYPDAVAVADLSGDGVPDLVVADGNPSNTVSVLLGNGDGSFQPPISYAVGRGPDALAVADLGGDGKPDIITANAGDNTVSVLLGNGDGTFQNQHTYAVGDGPTSLAVADVNGDGKPDLVVLNLFSDTVSVLRGNGDGTFQNQQTVTGAGSEPRSLAVADLSGDGKPDLVVAELPGLFAGVNTAPGTIDVLRGNGDGTFQDNPQADAVGASPGAVAAADLAGDGKPDIITANGNDNTVSVLRGNGDGTFQNQQTVAVGGSPRALAVADLNGDGKPDLVVTNERVYGGFGHTVSVLLGNGDGTFQPPQSYPVGIGPLAVAVADLTGDGIPDLIVASLYGKQLMSVLLGNGDGTFRKAQTIALPAGTYPQAVAVADLSGDGKPDIIIDSVNADNSCTVDVLIGNGDGTFQPAQTYPVGNQPTALAVADLTGNGIPDLVVTNASDNTVSVLLGNGDGTFQPQQTYAVGSYPSSVAVADVNGKPAIVTANFADNSVSVLLDNGDGTLRPDPYSPDPYGAFPVGNNPNAVTVADVNDDGKADLVVANAQDNSVSVLLGNGVGAFTAASPTAAVARHNTPYLADLAGTGVPDSVVLDGAGDILVRKGLGNGQFAPPVVLNPGHPARDLTVLRTAAGWAVAAADAGFDPTLSTAGHFVYTVSLYTVAADGSVTRSTAFATPFLPTGTAAGDLTGDGLGDLVAADSLDDSIQVALQQPDGTFGSPITLPTGEAPSDMALVDVNGDGLPDIVVSNQASGDVSVFLNDPSHSFATSYRFRAGPGVYGLDASAAGPVVTSLEQSVSLAAGDFTGDGRNDLVVVNRGTHSFTVLPNDGGGFADPEASLTTSTSDGSAIDDQPGPVVAGYFNGPDQPLDLAVLMEDSGQVWIYTGHGDGTFTHTASIAAGTSPTGLSVVPGSAPGLFDLLVGNEFGDVLRLVGDGHGHFQPPPSVTGDHTALDVQPLQAGGSPDALVADQKDDLVTVQAPVGGGVQFAPVQTLADNPATQLAPGAVQWAKLEGPASPFFDAVVVASGSNSVLVYRGTGFDAAGNPTFAPPVSYPVGQDPVSVTIADVTGDGIPDLLVANQGSNDVSVLFGSLDARGDWVGRPGPRLKSGGSGPIAVAVQATTDPARPNLVVTNGQSGNLAVLPGVGQGFFNDQNPQILNVPGNPVLQGASFFGTSGMAVTADGRVVGFNFDDFAATVATVFTPPAGQAVTALEALAGGDLVVAEEGGTVALLGPGSSVQVLTPLTGLPSDPSALAVLEGADGLRVLVTNAGQDQLFVYGVGAPELPPIFLPNQGNVLLPLVAGAPVAEATALGEAPLGLVVTLSAGLLPAGPSGAANATAAAETAPAVALVFLHAGDEAENAAAAAPPADGTIQESDFELGIDEMLRRLELYRKPEERRPAGLFFGMAPRTKPGEEVLAPAAARQALGEGLRPGPRFEGAAAVGTGPAANASQDLLWLDWPAAGADDTAAPVLRPDDARNREGAWAVALAAAGLALWVERRPRAAAVTRDGWAE